MNAYNFAAESFHITKKLYSRFSSRKKFHTENGKKSLLGPLWRLGATYDVHLRLIGKLVGDFLLVIIELFSLGALFLSQFTRVTDRRTDTFAVAKTALHICSAVKTWQLRMHCNLRQPDAAQSLRRPCQV